MATTDKMRVMSAATRSGAGLQTFTISGFGTPTAAIMLLSRATADATVNNIGYGIGFTDGTNMRCIVGRERDNKAKTEADKGNFGSTSVNFMNMPGTGANPNNGRQACDFTQFVTDGIEGDWTYRYVSPDKYTVAPTFSNISMSRSVFSPQALKSRDITIGVVIDR